MRRTSTLTILLTAVTVLAGCAVEENPYPDDQAACGGFSDIVKEANSLEIVTAADVSESDADTFTALTAVANATAGLGRFEDTAGGATDAALISAAAAIAETESIGISADDAYRDETRIALVLSKLPPLIEDVADACEALGYPLEERQLAFEIAAPAHPADIEADPAVVAGPEVPDGFHDADNGLAYAWADESSCDYLRCIQLQLYAYEFCGSVYVEANQVDGNGVVRGFTNDLLGQLEPGQQAVATLTITESAAVSAELTEVRCT